MRPWQAAFFIAPLFKTAPCHRTRIFVPGKTESPFREPFNETFGEPPTKATTWTPSLCHTSSCQQTSNALDQYEKKKKTTLTSIISTTTIRRFCPNVSKCLFSRTLPSCFSRYSLIDSFAGQVTNYIYEYI